MLTLEAEPDHEARLFFDLDLSRGAVVAISGGSDSTALLFLLNDFCRRHRPHARLVAVTVDHALRPASYDEALKVGALCASLGIEHRIRVWEGQKPKAGLLAAARDARYRLLAGVARDEGIPMVLTGHTANDQAETVTMRLERRDVVDATERGLAGMAPFTLFDGDIWIVRPLLGMRREALRAMLRTRGAGWMDDPTNEDHSYERPRVRATLDEPGIAAALKVAEAAGRNRSDLDARAASLVRRHASRPARGLFRLDPAFADEEDRAAAIHALRLLLSTIGGLPMLPDEAAVTSLLEALGKGGSHRATLARVLVDARRTGIFLLREARGLPAPMRAVDGMLWDGRFRVSMRKTAPAPVVRAGAVLCRGGPVAGTLPNPFPLPDVPESLVRAALAAEPEVDCAGENVALMPVIAPFARFLPGFDVQSAGILAELAMASPLPSLPLPNAAV